MSNKLVRIKNRYGDYGEFYTQEGTYFKKGELVMCRKPNFMTSDDGININPWDLYCGDGETEFKNLKPINSMTNIEDATIDLSNKIGCIADISFFYINSDGSYSQLPDSGSTSAKYVQIIFNDPMIKIQNSFNANLFTIEFENSLNTGKLYLTKLGLLNDKTFRFDIMCCRVENKSDGNVTFIHEPFIGMIRDMTITKFIASNIDLYSIKENTETKDIDYNVNKLIHDEKCDRRLVSENQSRRNYYYKYTCSGSESSFASILNKSLICDDDHDILVKIKINGYSDIYINMYDNNSSYTSYSLTDANNSSNIIIGRTFHKYGPLYDISLIFTSKPNLLQGTEIYIEILTDYENLSKDTIWAH